jgi:peptide/nickel transport system ATP-binding protein
MEAVPEPKVEPVPPDPTPRPVEAAPAAAPSTPAPPGAAAPVVLDVRDLVTNFYTYDGVVQALSGVSFKIRRGETLGLVGETGCGKSVTAFSITRLIPEPPGRVVSGKVLFRGANLLWGIEREARFRPIAGTNRVKVRRSFRRIQASAQRMLSVRGSGISMIFQEPTQAMNPIASVGGQIGEVIYTHRGLEAIDRLLGATPDAPAVEAAIGPLAEAIGTGSSAPIRAAAKVVADAAHLPSLELELFYVGRELPSSVTDVPAALRRVVARSRLTPGQRRYLRAERRRLELDRALRRVYFEEMRRGAVQRTDRVRLRSGLWGVATRTLPYRVWGVRRHVRRPIERELHWEVVALLEGVQIPNPSRIAKGYPHELSGGMLQRVMIASALSTHPAVLLADEPTTALDVTIQAQILDLMARLKESAGTAILLITHDLAVVAEVADRVIVMYAGQVVEDAPVGALFSTPLHPYTQGLLASIPRFDRPEKQLESIVGSVPNLIYPPAGCRFHPRCSFAMPICKTERPPMTDEGGGRHVACHLYHGPAVQQ